MTDADLLRVSTPLRSLRLTTPRGPLHAMVAGALDGDRPVAVLLHGGFGSWRHWIANIDDLARHHDLVIPDLPGCGDSCGVPDDHDLDLVAGATWAGLSEVIDRPDAVIGFSFGTLVSCWIASHLHAQGRAVRRVVLVNPPPGLGLSPEAVDAQRRAGELARTQGLEAGLALTVREIMLSRPELATPEVVSLFAEQVRRTRLNGRAIASAADVQTMIERVPVTCHLVFGDLDPHQAGSLERRCARFTELFGADRVHRFPDAAHWLQFDRAARFDELVARILRG